MHVFTCIVFIVLSEAAKRPDAIFDDDPPSPQERKADDYPEHVPEPVPFGHIYLDGFGDPHSSIKQPVDGLELLMRLPKNSEEAREALKMGRKNIAFLNPEIMRKISTAKENFLREMMLTTKPPEEQNLNETRVKWYDFAAMQLRNAQRPPHLQFGVKRRNETRRRHHSSRVPAPPDQRDRINAFAKNSFELKKDKTELTINWTTCDQFAVGAIFSHKDIVNMKWTPFYVWSTDRTAYSIEHIFLYPTKKQVNEYFTKYNNFLNKTIDWSKPKLLMKGMNEMLLIALDKRGLFDAIVKHEIPESAQKNIVKIPSLSLRLKIEDPYLAMMYCEEHFAMLMAISGRQPTTFKDMKAEAETINFQGIGRPVWRDYAGEKENMRLLKEAKIKEEQDKFITVNEPGPRGGQWE